MCLVLHSSLASWTEGLRLSLRMLSILPLSHLIRPTYSPPQVCCSINTSPADLLEMP